MGEANGNRDAKASWFQKGRIREEEVRRRVLGNKIKPLSCSIKRATQSSEGNTSLYAFLDRFSPMRR